jgi:phosphatidate cytidylyltransferase
MPDEPQQQVARRSQDHRHQQQKTPPEDGSNRVARVVTGATWGIVIAACLLASAMSSVIVVTVIGVFCSYELYHMMHPEGLMVSDVLGMVVVLMVPAAYYLGGLIYLYSLVLVYLIVLLVWFVLSASTRFEDVTLSLFGVVYCGLMLACLLIIRLQVSGIQGGLLALGVALSVWANDTFAYAFGSKFGAHKLAPKISPNKSWEGFIAGVAGSIIAWCLVPPFVPQVSWPVAIIAGLVCGLTGVFGDFVESRLKRTAGVKDAGHILPGHGGFLDRSDSLIFVSTVALFILGIGMRI